jgi:hypothetical protein
MSESDIPVIPAKAEIQAIERELDAAPDAARLLALAEEVLEIWITARGDEPTQDKREGFRLLALHHQGTRGVPSFNACRETCREAAWHYNLLTLEPEHAEGAQRLRMMKMVVRHLALFVGGKLEVEGLGDFCCASRPLRQDQSSITNNIEHGERNA